MTTPRSGPDAGDSRWEVGGEFGLASLPHGAADPFPTPHRLFSIATHTVIALWQSLDPRPMRRLHVPDYFCPEVTDAWDRAGIPLITFPDDPRWPQPDWTALAPTSGDVVLAVDFFGARAGKAWADWHSAHPDVQIGRASCRERV